MSECFALSPHNSKTCIILFSAAVINRIILNLYVTNFLMRYIVVKYLTMFSTNLCVCVCVLVKSSLVVRPGGH